VKKKKRRFRLVLEGSAAIRTLVVTMFCGDTLWPKVARNAGPQFETLVARNLGIDDCCMGRRPNSDNGQTKLF
jgi:hypothetical protein